MAPYLENPDSKLPMIAGFEIRRSVRVPDINTENVLNGSLQQCSDIKFHNSYRQ